MRTPLKQLTVRHCSYIHGGSNNFETPPPYNHNDIIFKKMLWFDEIKNVVVGDGR